MAPGVVEPGRRGIPERGAGMRLLPVLLLRYAETERERELINYSSIFISLTIHVVDCRGR